MSGTARVPRVTVLGYMNEVNALADPITRAHGIDASQGDGGLAASWEAGALIRRLRELREVEVCELPVWEFGATGPLDGADFRSVLADIVDGLRRHAPIDAVAVLGHGAGRTTDDLDPDATFLAAVRAEVGPQVPVVVVLDFHANLSPEMVEHSDVLVGYRTNPHVDIEDRLVEAADHIDRLLDAPGTVRALCRPPLLLPQIAQLTSPDEPLGQVVARGQELAVPPVRNVTVLGGFSLSDVPDCGVTVCVTADLGHTARAAAVAEELGALAWQLQPRYRMRATPLADAVAIAGAASAGSRSPVILADVADNPGGGAPGNTTFILEALLDAGVRDVVMGLQFDPAVVEQAYAAGVGGVITAAFNAGSDRPLARPFSAPAIVLSLVDGPYTPTRGMFRGTSRHPGRCCALAIGGVRIGVSSRRIQTTDDDTLRHVGLDPAGAKVVVVKSRGHFRAGFDHLFAPDQIVEVGAPGVATPELDTVQWQHIRRPVVPLDDVTEWEPVVQLFTSGVGT